MGLEIERRYLFNPCKAPTPSSSVHLKQAYLSLNPEVRIRLSDAIATMTIKTGTGIARGEWEYAIPKTDAVDLISLTPWFVVEKRRGVVHFADSEWILDEYLGENSGLYIAELELSSEQQSVQIPPWIDAEVTLNSRYNAASLAQVPYRRRANLEQD